MGKPKKKASDMMVDGEEEEEEEQPLKVYLPGMELAEGEVLEADMSAYHMLQECAMEWPCLSFDVLRDGLGEERTGYPMSCLLATGTQSGERCDELLLMKWSNLRKTYNAKHGKGDEDSDSESDAESEEEEDESSGSARIGLVSVPHEGCVNRIRASRAAEGLLATWSDTGKVFVWSLAEALSGLGLNSQQQQQVERHRLSQKPTYAYTGHRCEGYALEWHKQQASLLSGDCSGSIHLNQLHPTGSGNTTATFNSHTQSVEDLQWSPTEATVFASCSADGAVKVWDTRMPTAAGLSTQVSSSDCNVISWNAQVGHLLASGHDDGSFATWDLRSWTSGNAQALFASSWHRDQVTSVEWNPTDASVLAVAGADDQLTIWDFAVTAYEGTDEQPLTDVPPQLLFIHQGQQAIKELHWHPQLSGVIISTAASGFNIFKTISV
jgi:ribosome assembly protein RRB1